MVIHLEKDAARILKLHPRTLQRYRKDGTGPKFVRRGRPALVTPTRRSPTGSHSTPTQALRPNTPQPASRAVARPERVTATDEDGGAAARLKRCSAGSDGGIKPPPRRRSRKEKNSSNSCRCAPARAGWGVDPLCQKGGGLFPRPKACAHQIQISVSIRIAFLLDSGRHLR